MKKLIIVSVAIFLAALYSVAGSNVAVASDGERVVVKTGRGISQPFLFAKPANPKGGFLLFVGGSGVLDIANNGDIKQNENNFTVRMIGRLLDQGYMAAVVDVPSDFKGKKKITDEFRISTDHANDMVSVIKYMEDQAKVPIWLHGTSRGTFDAASLAIKKQNLVAGLVLTGTLTKPDKSWPIAKKYPNGVIDMNLNKLKIPVFIASHKNDGCDKTPPADGEKLKKKASESARVEFVLLDGGSPPKSDPCEALSQHGFYGMLNEATDRILAFVEAGG